MFDTLQASQEGRLRFTQACKKLGWSQQGVADAAGDGITIDTVKRLLGTKSKQAEVNRVTRWQVERLAQVVGLSPTDIVDPKDWYRQQLPPEFEPLIGELTQRFYGRNDVFQKIESFLDSNHRGYIIVLGYPGMGKSATAAKYAADNCAICYFNILAEGRNQPELFLKSIRDQLIERYDLHNAKDANLLDLLTQVSRKLLSTERLVIVVDALDEVKQESSKNENILYLPTVLPYRVYFLLTRRPYTQDTKRLTVSPGVPVEELNLTEFNHKDVKGYIHLFLNEDPDYRDALRKWIQNRNLTPEDFVEQLADKSENNFMYLRYILPAIARGDYDDLSLKQLPVGLQNYYHTHWVRMRMDDALNEIKVKILFTLVLACRPSCKVIADILEQDEYDVQSILDEWIEYLKEQIEKGEICYRIYHTSFLDFLKGKKDLDSKRKLLKEVHQRISDYLY
ncbi:AAA family ATPase [Chroococcidiopsis sp. CCNUC1]|uniref:AAA family ATPase n=1 Tax=Chroococcidiopsis sp. CCNUC1 TaxID=2653189 RepID=UPI0020220408|nr:AAA family ATPase [Chroococcidiopsis sp. CCNUC1]URD53704.1 AAA family ATPase [Chroococcidiopsis sp. CCNUC1]